MNFRELSSTILEFCIHGYFLRWIRAVLAYGDPSIFWGNDLHLTSVIPSISNLLLWFKNPKEDNMRIDETLLFPHVKQAIGLAWLYGNPSHQIESWAAFLLSKQFYAMTERKNCSQRNDEYFVRSYPPGLNRRKAGMNGNGTQILDMRISCRSVNTHFAQLIRRPNITGAVLRRMRLALFNVTFQTHFIPSTRLRSVQKIVQKI